MTRLVSLLAIGLVLLPSAARAQEPPSSVLPGSRVRVWTSPSADPVTGRVLSLDGQWMTVLSDSRGTPVGVSRDSITRMDVSLARRSKRKAALTGALTGLGFGLVLGVVSYSDRQPGPASGAGLIILPALLTPVGAVIGLVAGSAGERWTTLSTSAKLSQTVAPPAPSLRFSFRF